MPEGVSAIMSELDDTTVIMTPEQTGRAQPDDGNPLAALMRRDGIIRLRAEELTMSSDNTIDTGVITARMRALSTDASLEILVIDDDELARALLSDRLSARGFQVTQAGDGREALSLTEKHDFGVLLVDWQMPEMDGIELTQQLRAKGMRDTCVIMLTARDGDVDYEQGYLAGVDDYLSKKVRDIELMARIHSAFTTYSLRRELRETRAQLAAAIARK
jgi:CheY-like chemotaxis protein